MKLRDAVPVGSEIFPEIQSVTLPKRGDAAFPADGARCMMVGWGCTSKGKLRSIAAKNHEFDKLCMFDKDINLVFIRIKLDR